MVIALATDLTGDDDAAVVHASALAVASGATLVALHADRRAKRSMDLDRLVGRWSRPLDLELRWLDCDDEIADTIVDAILALRPSLVVAGTHARRGIGALLRGSVGEAIARNARVPTLLVPDRVPGFVDATTGAIDLRCILIPAGTPADAEHGIEAARWFQTVTGGEPPRRQLVHVGAVGSAFDGFGVTRFAGDLEPAIVDAARWAGASLVVMPTRGHDSVGDVLAGSHMEHVLREVGRPVLAVPY
jgi:nucleotide-binding universal stress UspA family protein